ncbi:enoyl-CoA hydratase-related protein [Pseudomonas sp. KNUC1026]|uniref:enoyl-CoA hydratase-related protein n=1 Tax=Pseudomonas sp. KNUC1026 TaxID=2893890 RepID=UPI001F43CBA6|nr:enoyl-CoA hydratase-related protein [Pseudomonas sp. KNUC1026]UFH51517.1 enoyl-CoA hydratase-related protein [Pseudomonas sp. KNUC1026]
MADYQTLELCIDHQGLATLWLNRPDKHNAFDAQMITELTGALEQVRENPRIRLLVLRGRGKHFSAGADLAWMQASAALDLAANLADAQALAALMHALHNLPMPTLALVHGAAYGGALGLVSACDLAIGAADARFCLSEVRIGLIPAVISPFVVKAMGERQARRYMLTAEPFSGEQAARLGLLHEAAPLAELEAVLARWVNHLLLGSPQALRACKQLLATVVSERSGEQVRQYTETAIARIRVSDEGQEGLRAFLEKRRPAWQEPNP